MRFYGRAVVAWLAVFTLATFVGCGGDDAQEETPGDGATTTQIPGSTSPGPNLPTANGQSTPGTVAMPSYEQLHPKVVIETSQGNITVELDAENAPRSTENFLAYVDDLHYSGTIFHQVLRDQPHLIIGGAWAYSESDGLAEKPVRSAIQSEAANGLKNERGTIAMARDIGVDTATCHFFLNVTDNSSMLDYTEETVEGYGYCVFGKIVEGLNVLDKLGALEVHNTDELEQTPVDPQAAMIKSITHAR